MADSQLRPVVDVKAPVGGWLYPWPNVAELAQVLPPASWTLIGGLMAQLHAVHHSIDAVRPTNDVDIALHIETTRGAPNATADALESLGYVMKKNVDARNKVGHRFTRGDSHVDVMTSVGQDIVDIVVADHAAPSVRERMRGKEMVKVPGGTQALRRTVNYRLEIAEGKVATISAPRPFGALVLKVAAYMADTRDRERHLFDAAVLLACIEDPFAERDGFTGSDRSRLLVLQHELVEGHSSLQRLPERHARRSQAVLHALCAVD